jgi:hypothetical protein
MSDPAIVDCSTKSEKPPAPGSISSSSGKKIFPPAPWKN